MCKTQTYRRDPMMNKMSRWVVAWSAILATSYGALCETSSSIELNRLASELSQLKVVGDDNADLEILYMVGTEGNEAKIHVDLKASGQATNEMFIVDGTTVSLDLSKVVAITPSAGARLSQNSAAQTAGLISLAAITARENIMAGAFVATLGMAACANGQEQCRISAVVTVTIPPGYCVESLPDSAGLGFNTLCPKTIKDARAMALAGVSFPITVLGVVVANRLDSASVLHLQMRSEDVLATSGKGFDDLSEAILIDCEESTFCNEIEEGDLVEVTGSPRKNFDSYEIIPSESIQRLPCPEPIFLNEAANVAVCAEVNVPTLTFPLASRDAPLKFDNMLISIDTEMTITDTYSLRFGTVRLSSQGLLFSATMVVSPGDEAVARAASDALLTIDLDDGRGVTCPLDPFLEIGGTNSTRAGDVFPGSSLSSTTVLTKSFNSWTLNPTLAGYQYIPGQRERRIARLETIPDEIPSNSLEQGQLRLAGLNVLNYFTNLGNCSDCRGAENEAEFQRQKTKIFNAIREIDAAVIALQEIQNDEDSETLLELVSSLNEFLGEEKYAAIETGFVGQDAIACAIIYQPDLVQPSEDFKTFDYSGGRSRTALAQKFTVQNSIEEDFTVVSQHFKSKGSACDEDNSTKIEFENRREGEGNCGFLRLTHVEEFLAWIGDANEDFSDRIAVIGDMNSHFFDRSMVRFREGGFTDLAARDIENPFSYQFSGFWATLDYIMTNSGLESRCGSTYEWHINSVESVFLDYTDQSYSNCNGPKPDEWFDPNTPFRASDHDPLITVCQFTVDSNIKAVRAAIDKNIFMNARIKGIVTASKSDEKRGFYMQMTAADAQAVSDPDLASVSEGIFIFCNRLGSNCEDVVEGSLVQVTGTASIFRDTIYQLVPSSEEDIEVLDCSNSTVINDAGTQTCEEINVPVLSLPVASLDDYKQYDNMLVQFDKNLTITSTFELQFGAVRLSSDGIIMAPTMEVDPGQDAVERDAADNLRLITLDDGMGETCPVDPFLPIGGDDSIRAWDFFSTSTLQATTVLAYEFNAWTLIPTTTGYSYIPQNIERSEEPRQPSLPETYPPNNAEQNQVRIASLNVLNYFTNLGDCSACRGAENEAEFQRQKTKIFIAIREIDAAIFALQEIQNDEDSGTLLEFVSSLNTFLGEEKYAAINTGFVGQDAIACAIIYQPDLVTPIGPFRTLDYSGGNSRTALVQDFETTGGSEVFTIANQHFKSKGSACIEDNEENEAYEERREGEGNCGVTRRTHVREFLEWISTQGNASEKIAVLGDLNSHVRDRSLQELVNGGYISLADRDIISPYSFQFNGRWATLDYFMANEALANACEQAYEWHINSVESILLDYTDTGYSSCNNQKPEGWYDGTTPYRGSDHDPLVAVCVFESAT